MIKKYKQMTIDALESLSLTDKEALNELGERLFYKKEYQKSLEYFKKSAILGNDMAINNLGVLYDRNKNYKKAGEYYLMAINKKCSFAYNNLGNLYEDIYQDYEKAKELYSKCFKETENTEALICIAKLYSNYYSDDEKAKKYLEKAMKLGNVEARHILERHFK
ncbi:tetratricopeptide repeat protein [Leptotrichia sp. oral taxon 879]|uniref:tetratricopeptide repeat protein n=1 Tax=Leptotrichia sp. oral taxon 879 TaxID=1227267 RepID=UPI000428DD82|nr:tetratricopeptide repeat protein [Leptotrichia sp. oral taxon 879]